MKKRFQTPLCALSALVLAAACTTAAYAAEIPVPADAIPVPQAAPADVPADAVSGADLILPEAEAAVAERIPMPVDDAPAVWTEGRSAAVSMQAPVEGKSLSLPEGTAVTARIPMPVVDAPAVWTEGRSAVVSAQTAVDGQSLILTETRRP